MVPHPLLGIIAEYGRCPLHLVRSQSPRADCHRLLFSRSKSRFGRRRPFIVGGCVLTIIATLMLSRAKNIAALFLGSDSPVSPTLSFVALLPG